MRCIFWGDPVQDFHPKAIDVEALGSVNVTRRSGNPDVVFRSRKSSSLAGRRVKLKARRLLVEVCWHVRWAEGGQT
jgi:hypothetical protein